MRCGTTRSTSLGPAPDKAARRRQEEFDRRAHRRVAENLFPKIVGREGGRLRLADQPPLMFHPPELDVPAVKEVFIEAYRASLPADRRVLFDRYRFEDAAVKVVGVGSVGTK